MNTPTYHITIADKIKAYRSEYNLSLKEFGKLLGVSAQAVCKWGAECLLSRHYLSAASCENFGM